MAYKISAVEMEGIRGINKPVGIELNDRLTVIHGPNGSGKSSVLQAIEWCLTGKIPYMRGGDFGKEDAIVNAFTRNKRASVKLSFKGPQEIMLTRGKKQTRGTVSKRYDLLLEADRSYEKSDAELFLLQNLDFNCDESGQSKFLHQETIRDTLSYGPTQRSAVIEKLLGTYEIKEFSKALDQKSRFTREINNIDARVEALQKDRIQLIFNLRNSLNELKEGLLRKGFNELHLDLAFTLKEIGDIRTDLDQIAQRYERPALMHPELSPSIESLASANNRAEADITSLDRIRMNTIGDLRERSTTINMLLGSYSNALELFKEYETLDLEDLKRKRSEIEGTRMEVDSDFKKAQNILTLLPSRISAYESEKNVLDSEKERLEETLLLYGDDPKLLGEISSIENDLSDIKQELEKYSGQQRIVNEAVALIEATHPDNCPVCNQSIDPKKLVEEIKVNVSTDISNKISELTEARNTKNQKNVELNKHRVDLRNLKGTIKSLTDRVQKAKENLEGLVGDVSEDTDLESISKEKETKVGELRVQLNDLESQFREYNEQIQQFNHLDKAISENRNKLQEEIGQSLDGQELVDAADLRFTEIKGKIVEYENTKEIDILTKRRGQLTEILNFLSDKDRTEKAEKELPALEEQKEELGRRKTGLLILSGALTSIKKFVTQYQRETSIKQIRDLEDMMNETFQSIQGHPYFSRLKIEIEKEDPLQFSFRAISDRDSTYIPTRFSTAQLNIAALSIFISNSRLLAGKLPVISLDDPTQNMDDEHKKTFVDYVSRLTEHFQVIIATEDDETRDFLKKELPSGTYYEIQSWDTEGPQIS